MINSIKERPRPQKVYETVDKTRITETAGYMPAQVQIQQFLNAGVRLNDFRKEMYDFDTDEVDMDFEDPTRALGFDLAEGSELQQIAAANLQKSIDGMKKPDDTVVQEQPKSEGA